MEYWSTGFARIAEPRTSCMKLHFESFFFDLTGRFFGRRLD